jgi:hypothetical protein
MGALHLRLQHPFMNTIIPRLRGGPSCSFLGHRQ